MTSPEVVAWGSEGFLFNAKDGFLEGIIRGCRGGLLSVHDYNNLTQCETLDDVKLHLVSQQKEPKQFFENRNLKHMHSLSLSGHSCINLKKTDKADALVACFFVFSFFQCSTDYVSVIQNEPSPLHPSTIVSRCTQKIVDDFNMVRCQVWRLFSANINMPPQIARACGQILFSQHIFAKQLRLHSKSLTS